MEDNNECISILQLSQFRSLWILLVVRLGIFRTVICELGRKETLQMKLKKILPLVGNYIFMKMIKDNKFYWI